MEDDGEFFNQRQSNSFDDEEVMVLGDILLHSAAFSSESESLSPQTQNNSATTTTATAIAAEGAGSGTLSFDDNNNNRKRCKILSKSNSSNSIASQLAPEKPATSSQKSYILSFDDSNVGAGASSREGGGGRKHQGGGSARCASRGANQTHQGGKKGRNSSESLGHIMAERKRRQELTERFIALSATIPGLKKIDKASILGEAINYVKQLQERVKTLEDQSSEKIKVDSVSFTNKADLYSEEGTASSKTSSDECQRLNVALPEVEARALEKQVLIRIHCKKQSDEMLKILTHLKSFDLSTVSSSVLPFGNSALDITIIAQMGGKYNATVKDLVKSLRLSLLESPE